MSRTVEANDHRAVFMADFIRIVADAMKDCRINKVTLAKRLGITKGALSQMLDPAANLGVSTMVRIAAAVDVKLSLAVTWRCR